MAINCNLHARNFSRKVKNADKSFLPSFKNSKPRNEHSNPVCFMDCIELKICRIFTIFVPLHFSMDRHLVNARLINLSQIVAYL